MGAVELDEVAHREYMNQVKKLKQGVLVTCGDEGERETESQSAAAGQPFEEGEEKKRTLISH